jgi:hypothetical protein
MRPDRTNYELWFVDYLDGKLEEDQVSLLMQFLEQNPDLREELNDIANIVPSENTAFPGKDKLKKTISDIPASQFEILCVSSLERDTNRDQERELAEIISSSHEKKKVFEEFKKIRLVPYEIKYPKKSSLKHLTLQQKITRISLAASGIAAGIALFFIIYNSSGPNPTPSLVSVNQPIPLTSVKINAPQTNEKADLEIKKAAVKPQEQLAAIEISADAIRKVEETVTLPLDTDKEKTADVKPELSKSAFINDVRLTSGEAAPLLATMHVSPVDPEAFYEKSGINEYFAWLVREKILKAKIPETGPLKGYEVASAGIVGINRLLGWDMSLKPNRNDKGELKSLYFSSKMIKFNAPVKKTLASL